MIVACKGKRDITNQGLKKVSTLTDTGLIVVAKDIITEVIVNQDTTGDPWEVEKIQGYIGKPMIDKLFEDIYSNRIIVYDFHSGLELTPKDIKKLEEEINSDRSSIGKLQFTEDWYFDPESDAIIKDVKSIVFGAELKEESGKLYGYKALFQMKLK